MTHRPPHLVLVLRPDAPADLRARTAVQLSEVARAAGADLVNRAIAAALPLPGHGSVVVRCDADRCVRLEVREVLAERVTLRT